MSHFFEVTKADESLFNVMYFVAGAVAKRNTGSFELSYIKVENSRIIATDGCRIHIANIDHHFKPGFYFVIKRTKTLINILGQDDISNYPDIDSVIKSCELDKRENISLKRYKNEASVLYSTIIRVMEYSLTVNFKYIEDVIPYAADIFSVDGRGPVVMADEKHTLQAFIMPLLCNLD